MGPRYERAKCEKYRSFMAAVIAAPCFASSFAKCAPPRLRDPYPRYLDRARAHRHALGICCDEPCADQLKHLFNREATRKHDRLGAAVRAGGEQFKRPPTVGLGAAPAAFCWLFGVRGPQRRHSVLTQVERGVFPLPPSSINYMPRLWRGARQENSNSCRGPVNPSPDTGPWPPSGFIEPCLPCPAERVPSGECSGYPRIGPSTAPTGQVAVHIAARRHGVFG